MILPDVLLILGQVFDAIGLGFTVVGSCRDTGRDGACKCIGVRKLRFSSRRALRFNLCKL